MPLALLGVGESGTITDIRGMIIAVKGSRVALNRGMASKITVNR